MFSLTSTLIIESLSIYYMMSFDKVIATVTAFLKLWIIARFDDFFLIPFKGSNFISLLGNQLKFTKYRQDKVILDNELIKKTLDNYDV